MPLLGLGVYGMHGADAERAVSSALEAGYRHIDTAALYRNEREVGKAVRESGIPREKIFVTTKLFPTGFFRPEVAFQDSLQKLGLDYVDLYLIHWPAPGKSNAWKVLEKIHKQKLARSIGVSNYNKEQIDDMLSYSKIVPAVNQMEFHPFNRDLELVNYCQKNNIVFEAYSPLNRGRGLDDPIIVAIAQKLERTPVQVILRWNIQRNIAVIPKSTHQERIIENSKIFDFELTEEDMKLIDSISE
jgi:diketogulonate reductase-like aldo/keto reductase